MGPQKKVKNQVKLYADQTGREDDLELCSKIGQISSGRLSHTLKFLRKHNTLLKCHITRPFITFYTTIQVHHFRKSFPNVSRWNQVSLTAI